MTSKPDAPVPPCVRCGQPIDAEHVAFVNGLQRKLRSPVKPPKLCHACLWDALVKMENEDVQD